MSPSLSSCRSCLLNTPCLSLLLHARNWATILWRVQRAECGSHANLGSLASLGGRAADRWQTAFVSANTLALDAAMTAAAQLTERGGARRWGECGGAVKKKEQSISRLWHAGHELCRATVEWAKGRRGLWKATQRNWEWAGTKIKQNRNGPLPVHINGAIPQMSRLGESEGRLENKELEEARHNWLAGLEQREKQRGFRSCLCLLLKFRLPCAAICPLQSRRRCLSIMNWQKATHPNLLSLFFWPLFPAGPTHTCTNACTHSDTHAFLSQIWFQWRHRRECTSGGCEYHRLLCFVFFFFFPLSTMAAALLVWNECLDSKCFKKLKWCGCFLPLPSARTIALGGRERDSLLLISLFLFSWLIVPPPFFLPLSLLFFRLSLPLYHFPQRTVFLCSKLGWRRFYPWRIQSGLQSSDDCRHECCLHTSLAPFFSPSQHHASMLLTCQRTPSLALFEVMQFYILYLWTVYSSRILLPFPFIFSNKWNHSVVNSFSALYFSPSRLAPIFFLVLFFFLQGKGIQHDWSTSCVLIPVQETEQTELISNTNSQCKGGRLGWE